MCGIAGTVTTSSGDERGRVRAMTEALIHRGPDAGGEFVRPGVALGVRRLRVLDIESGDQPQCNENGSVWTVFNGEIYNFRELREELVRRGHTLRTDHSDTEAIVHLYEDFGDRLVERLEGMFALAVWDERRRTLVLARDRLGKKPLVYSHVPGRLVFASEHDALLRGLDGALSVDPTAVRMYLRLGYVPAPHDTIKGVAKLRPGHVLTWEDGRVTTRRYWAPPLPGTLRISEEEAVTETRRLLEAAVARRLVADVPVGAFLSGGVDSSGVVATMARLSARVRTFSIGFLESGYSELPHARRIAERYGTDHHELVVRADAAAILPDIIRHYGEPYADSSAIPSFYLSKLTRQHVTVALNGDGGDEAFGGYDRYAAAKLAGTLDRLPNFLRTVAVPAAARILPDSTWPRSSTRRLRRFLLAASLPPRERYLKWLGVFDRAQLDPLLDDDFARATALVEDQAPLSGGDGWRDDPVAAAQLLDLELYLPDDLLVKMDIASMAHSLEVRSPFLDREVVEFGVSLPSDLKVRGRSGKYVLKRALEDRVPRENLYRQKQGFGLPIGEWLRGELRPLAEDALLSGRLANRGYFRRAPLEALVRDHLGGRADHAHRLWSLLMLELWHRAYVDARVPAA